MPSERSARAKSRPAEILVTRFSTATRAGTSSPLLVVPAAELAVVVPAPGPHRAIGPKGQAELLAGRHLRDDPGQAPHLDRRGPVGSGAVAERAVAVEPPGRDCAVGSHRQVMGPSGRDLNHVASGRDVAVQRPEGGRGPVAELTPRVVAPARHEVGNGGRDGDPGLGRDGRPGARQGECQRGTAGQPPRSPQNLHRFPPNAWYVRRATARGRGGSTVKLRYSG